MEAEKAYLQGSPPISESPNNDGSGSPPSGNSGSGSKDSSTRATELIKAMQIDVPPPVMLANTDPGRMGIPYPLQTNAFGLRITNDTKIFVYAVTIQAETKNNKALDFTKKTRDDFLVCNRKAKCVDILNILFNMYPDVFIDRYKTFYDGQAILYTTYSIEIEQGKLEKTLIIEGSTLEGQLSDFKQFIITIKKAEKESFILSPETVATRTANLDLEDNDRTLQQFQDVVCNQHAIMNPQRHFVFENGKTYLVDGMKEGLHSSDVRELPEGKELVVGAQKVIRQIEGPLGRGTNNSALIIDSKKVCFHKQQDLVTKALTIVKQPLENGLTPTQREKIAKAIKGLYVRTTFLKNNKELYVVTLGHRAANEDMFNRNGTQISIVDHFKETYKKEVKYPRLPPVIVRERGQLNGYLMEYCEIIKGQRVNVSPDSAPSTKDSIVLPNVRQFYIKKAAESLNLMSNDNHYLRNAGIKIFQNPMKIDGRHLINPSIKYGEGNQGTVMDGKWKTSVTNKYLIPAGCTIWALYCFPDVNDRYDIDDLRLFAMRYSEEATRKGMTFPAPTDIQICKPYDLEEKLEVAAAHKCGFILCVVGDLFTTVHKDLKYFERKYEVVTQQIKCSNMCKIVIENKKHILENCVNKTNCKLGGLNYAIDVSAINGLGQKWFTPERLIIGIGLAAFPITSPIFESQAPTFIGFSANMKVSPFEFIGDFYFQEPKLGNVLTCLAEIIRICISRHQDAHKGVHCREIIIYRSRLDEGSYHSAITREIPHMKAQIKKMGLPDIPITYISVSKEHVMRLMKAEIEPAAPAPTQNIPAGIVCDTKITHPAYNEFYLNSHTTIQGTASTPRYTVLYDELHMTNDELQGQTWALCFGHQIVNLSISLPCCLYIAIEYASRGGNIWKEYVVKEASASENTSGYDEIIRRLCFQYSHNLRDFRVNA